MKRLLIFLSKLLFDEPPQRGGYSSGDTRVDQLKPPSLPPHEDPDVPQRLHGRRFLEALHNAGIINYKGNDKYVYGVTIEAFIDSAVKLTVYRYADDRVYMIKDLIEQSGFDPE